MVAVGRTLVGSSFSFAAAAVSVNWPQPARERTKLRGRGYWKNTATGSTGVSPAAPVTASVRKSIGGCALSSDDASDQHKAGPAEGGLPVARHDDPVAFVREVLRETPYDKQVEILRAIARSRRVSVVGCNGSGKDWAAARVVLWWLHSRSPAKAIVTGPTARQVDEIMWNELRYAYMRASDRLQERMFRTSRYELDEQSFALGFVTNSPYNLQGFHSPNMLVVITETHAVDRPDVDAIRRLNPSRLLMTGNPFVNSGVFYESHHTLRDLYETVQIGAEDTPNIKERRVVVPGMITVEDVADRKEEWGEDSALYVGSVLGKFPENLDGVMVPLWAATEAARREMAPEGPLVVACDVARFGRDKTVVIARQGPVARIVHRVNGHDTMRIVGFLKAYCDEHRPDVLVIDETGVGGGVVDRLRQLGLGRTRLVPFIAAKKAEEETTTPTARRRYGGPCAGRTCRERWTPTTTLR